jgi:hypothetical protein
VITPSRFTAAALFAAVIGAVTVVAAPPTPSIAIAATPDALQAELERYRPPKLVWRDVAWRKCLLEGLRQSREQQKPVLLWAFINSDPKEERC